MTIPMYGPLLTEPHQGKTFDSGNQIPQLNVEKYLLCNNDMYPLKTKINGCETTNLRTSNFTSIALH